MGETNHPTVSFLKTILQNQNEYIFNEWLAEDGGKFYFKRNRGLVKQVDYENTYLLDDSFMWLSLFQIKKLLAKKFTGKSSSIEINFSLMVNVLLVGNGVHANKRILPSLKNLEVVEFYCNIR